MSERRSLRRRLRLAGVLFCVVSASAVGASAASAGAARAAAVKNCEKGRSLLQCGEKLGLYDDSYTSAIGGFSDLVLFETRLPLPLGNRALSTFWRYQAVSTVARSELESSIINQGLDENFEQFAKRAKLRAPTVRPAGVIDRHTAAQLSALLLADEQVDVNLGGMDTALNRATAALVNRSRHDYVGYEESNAAGFAFHAAAALSRAIRDQRAASQALLARKLFFGVGPADLVLAQRTVHRAHSFTRPIVALLSALGVSPPLIGVAEAEFLVAKLGPTSYSLSQYLADPTLITDERHCIRALRHFFGRIPRHGRPPA